MIDWWLVTRNAVWIVGAAIVVWSWSYRRSSANGEIRLPFAFGFLLICVGQASLGGRWWEVSGWIVLTVLAGAQVWQLMRA